MFTKKIGQHANKMRNLFLFSREKELSEIVEWKNYYLRWKCLHSDEEKNSTFERLVRKIGDSWMSPNNGPRNGLYTASNFGTF